MPAFLSVSPTLSLLRGRLRHWLLAAAAAATGLLPAPAAMAQAGAPAAARPDLSQVVLRVGAPNKIGNRPYLQVAGLLKDLPYRIEWSEFGATPALLEALRAGNIDVGGNGGITGVLFESANNPGSGVRVVAAGRSVVDTGSAAILVRADSPYRSVKDLKGARVSVVKGTGSHYLIGQALKDAGLAGDDVRLLHLANDTALSSLVGNHIDAWVIWDPQATTLQARPDLRLLGWIGSKDDTYAIQYASSQALQNPAKRAAISDFLQRLARASVWVGAHPEPWAQVAAELTRLDPGVMLQIARKTRTEYGLTPEQQAAVQARFQLETDFWRTQGVVGRSLDIAQLFDASFNAPMLDETRAAKADSRVAAR